MPPSGRLATASDLSGHRWKDTGEYAQPRRLGVVDDCAGRQVGRARGRAIGMLEDRTGPFAGGQPAWAPDPSWPLRSLRPLPPLPPGADGAVLAVPRTGRDEQRARGR
ncbi:hypothetical protein [Kitasatospora sp. NPDC088779]|uniref:hypothetical protein n=1 Tax=Kitasatospora sp. NPDC088779 TaxID=3154964 RepID=UPI00341B86A9